MINILVYIAEHMRYTSIFTQEIQVAFFQNTHELIIISCKMVVFAYLNCKYLLLCIISCVQTWCWNLREKVWSFVWNFFFHQNDWIFEHDVPLSNEKVKTHVWGDSCRPPLSECWIADRLRTYGLTSMKPSKDYTRLHRLVIPYLGECWR